MVNRRTALFGVSGLAAAAMFGCSARGGSSTSRADDGDAAAIRYSYGPHPSQFAEITMPSSGAGLVPVAVVIHGGFWLNSFGLVLGRSLAQDLAARGIAAVNVEYRRVGSTGEDRGGWPQTGQDVATAVDGLHGVNEQLAAGRLDLGRVVSIGHSAGGQLAVWLAARRSAAVPMIGVVAQAGVLDLVTAANDGLGAGAVVDLMGGTPAERAQAYADASPLARVPVGVPSVCVHGRGDDVVPIDQSERFVAAAVRAGDTSELKSFDGGHFEPITVGSAAWTLCAQAVQRLLNG